MKKLLIKQLPFENRDCPWHKYSNGKVFDEKEILPNNTCPWLYNTIYPYFLGLLYGAKFKYNKLGDCQVCCPAIKGLDLVIRKRANNARIDSRIPYSMKFVIYAEVVKVLGKCCYSHKVKDKIIFPTCMMEHYLCPAGFHNFFPLLNLTPPKCINKNKIRCPDWQNVILYDIRINFSPTRSS